MRERKRNKFCATSSKLLTWRERERQGQRERKDWLGQRSLRCNYVQLCCATKTASILRPLEIQAVIINLRKRKSWSEPEKRWTQNRSLVGGAKYFNFCTPGTKLGFEISDKEKATRGERWGGTCFEEK